MAAAAAPEMVAGRVGIADKFRDAWDHTFPRTRIRIAIPARGVEVY